MTNPIKYRRLQSLEEFFVCEDLQQATWGFEDLSVVPAHLLVTFEKRGGIVLGAFDGDEMIGFVYGFVGYQFGMPTHNSVMSAVKPEYRNQGIAYQLKIEQRKLALEQNFSLMTWTFDPLQSLNAHFNLNKLGVVVRQYYQNIYGVFRDEINKGMPTDRLSVEWWFDSPRAERQLSQNQSPNIPSTFTNDPRLNNKGLLEPGKLPSDNLDKVLHLASPLSIDELKQKDLDLALHWRLHLRQWLETAFAQGYILHGFALDRQRFMGVYTLTKTDVDSILEAV
jgi:predicted GNAT superfamily acetyltransferase